MATPRSEEEKKNWVALHRACFYGQREVVEQLVTTGVDLDHQNERGQTALMGASFNGYTDVVNILLANGASPDIQMETGATALYIASQEGHTDVVRTLLEGRASPDLQEETGATALYIASQEGHTDIVRALLEGRASPDLQKKNGATALMVAAQNGHQSTVKILIKEGAKIDIQRNDGETALHRAAWGGHTEVVETLLHEGASPDVQQENGATALYVAAQNGHLPIVNILIKEGAKTDIQRNDGETALHGAAWGGHTEVVETLLHGGASPDVQQENGATALMIAAQNGHLPVVNILIKEGAKTDIQMNDGETALHRAAWGGHTEVVETLLHEGASPDVQKENGATALMVAAQNGHQSTVKILIKEGAKIDIQRNDGETALHRAAWGGHTEVVETLLHEGASPDVQQEDGATALFIASQEGHTDIVRALLEGRASPDLQKKNGATALYVAAQNGHLPIVNILIKEGAKTDIQRNNGETALHGAVWGGHTEVVETLLHGGASPDVQKELEAVTASSVPRIVEIVLEKGMLGLGFNIHGGTDNIHIGSDPGIFVATIKPKGAAAKNGRLQPGDKILEVDGHDVREVSHEKAVSYFHNTGEVVRILVDKWAEQRIRGKWKALWIACKAGHKKIVEQLLAAGVDLDLQNQDGAIALYIASQEGHADVVRTLLEGGASPDLQRKDGITALFIASQEGHTDVVRTLLEGRASPDLQMEDGFTPLMIASQDGHKEVVLALLRGGAKTDVQNKHGLTALILATYCKHPHVVEALLHAKANVNLQDEWGESAVTYACSKKDLESLQLLIKSGADPNIYTKDGKTPLLVACRKDNVQVAEALLVAGANPNFMAEDGLTALMLACTQGNKGMVELLLKHEASPDMKQPQTGFTALMFAVSSGDLEIVKKLISSGARVDLANLNERTAYDMALASANQHPEVYELISVVVGTTQSYLKPIEVKKIPEELIGKLLKVFIEKLDRDIPYMSSLFQKEPHYLASLPRKRVQDVSWTTAGEISENIWPYTPSHENIIDSHKPHSSGAQCDLPDQPLQVKDEPEHEQHGAEEKLEPQLQDSQGGHSEDKGLLLDMTDTATTSFTYVGRAETMDWSKYGLRLHFPDDGLSADATECLVNVTASLSGQFCFPEDTELISGIYTISASKFSKPVTLELQHCAIKEEEDTFLDLTFVVAKCSQKSPPYQFKMLDGGEFSPDSYWGSIELSHFSKIGAVRKRRPGKEYCGQLYYLATKPNCWHCHFAIVWNLQLHITEVDEKYTALGGKKRLDQPLHFQGYKITLDIPMEGITVNDGWSIKPLIPPTITKREVDNFSPGRRIPSCQLRVEWTRSEEPVVGTYSVKLLGAKEPFTFFSIECDPPPEGVVGLSSQTSLSTSPQKKESTPVSSTAEINAKPDLADALRILVPAAKEWKNIGVLLKVPAHRLDNIEQSHNNVPNECVREMLCVWLAQVDPCPTWRALADAVGVFNPATAQEIWKKCANI